MVGVYPTYTYNMYVPYVRETQLLTELNGGLTDETRIAELSGDVDEFCITFLMSKGMLSALKLLHTKQRYIFNDDIKHCDIEPAIENNQYETVKWIIDNFSQITINFDKLINLAIANGSLPLTKYLYNKAIQRKQNPDKDDMAFMAIEKGQIEIYKWLNITLTGVIHLAAGNGHLEMTKYIHSTGETLDPIVFIYALNGNNTQVLDYLLEQGCPIGHVTKHDVTNPEILDWCHRHGIL